MINELPLLGRTKDAALGEGIDDYCRRLRHYTTLSVRLLKDPGKTRGRSEDLVESEGRLLLKTVPPGAFVVVLDAGGGQYTSEQFAALISGWEQRGIKQVCYLIGGPCGHSGDVLGRADLLLSLSRMTFTHDMVRLLLLEQLYRAYTIKAGEKYHK
ncbi:MAG: 23S rRNA (pseudouridine(1915)-N(3))-methyltransferase RlmH [Desulfoprunum sp.]|uniref:23S rRNA (pseudouridine(1915)-N(3))-methyltransferase RlmH n=1 Tax=Desulfoprunum sp. TaxID=2020866 RepID=UPI003C727589